MGFRASPEVFLFRRYWATLYFIFFIHNRQLLLQLHKANGSAVVCKKHRTNTVNCHISCFSVFRKINSLGGESDGVVFEMFSARNDWN
jgi:hypothetical protein